MKKLILIILLLFITPAKTNAQDTIHISLETMIQQVESNYPAVLLYEMNVNAWKAKADGAKSWMAPTFSTGFMQFLYNLSMINEKNDPMNQAGIAFSLEQMIPNKSKLSAKQSYFNSLAAIEKNKEEWTKNELRKEVKVLYSYRYVNERKQLTVAESEEILKLMLTTAEKKFSNNQAQLQVIYKAKARLVELNNMQYMLSGLIAESNIGLNILMMQNVNSYFRIDTLIKPGKYISASLDTNIIETRSDIATMSSSIESMKLEQRLMKIGSRPDFGFKAEHAQMFGMPNQWSVMGMITLPIVPWSSKMYTSEEKSIGFQVQSMELEKQTMQLMAKKMLSEKLNMLNYEYGQYENYLNEIVPAYENNLQVNLLAYRQNTGDFFVLLDAWEMLLMKKLEMYDKLYTILKIEAEYEYETEVK